MSILSLLIVGVLSILKVINLFTRSDPTITTNQVFWDLPNDIGNVTAKEIGFDLAYWYHDDVFSEFSTAKYDETYFMPGLFIQNTFGSVRSFKIDFDYFFNCTDSLGS